MDYGPEEVDFVTRKGYGFDGIQLVVKLSPDERSYYFLFPCIRELYSCLFHGLTDQCSKLESENHRFIYIIIFVCIVNYKLT